MSARLHDIDFNVWPEEIAAALRSGKVEGLDFEHIAEDVEGLAKKNGRDLLNRSIILIDFA